MKKKLLFTAIIGVLCVALIIGAVALIKNRQYKQAVSLAGHETFSRALEQFIKLGDYKDSSKYVDYCLMRESIGESDWEAAKKYAAKIPGFLDADSYSQLCTAFNQYENGLYEDAITTLRSLSSLSEATALCLKVQKDYTEKTIAEIQKEMDFGNWDNALLHAEVALEYSGDERLSEMRARCKNLIAQRDYSAAIRAIRAGDHASARNLLSNIRDYEDSDALFNHLNNGEEGCAYVDALLLEAIEPHILYEAYAKAGSYADAAERAMKYHEQAQLQDYEKALYLIDSEMWNDAISILNTLPNYKDSNYLNVVCEQGILLSRYEEALYRMERKRYDQAELIFRELGEYKDSPVLLLVCLNEQKQIVYNDAVSAYNAGNYDSAFERFDYLGSYRDSQMYCRWISVNNEGSAQK